MKSSLASQPQTGRRIPIKLLLRDKLGFTEHYTLYAKYGENLLDLISRNFDVTLKSNEFGTWITSISGKRIRIREDTNGGIQGYINNMLPYVAASSSPFFLGFQNIAVTSEFELRMQYDPFLDDIRVPLMLKVKLLLGNLLKPKKTEDNQLCASCTSPFDKSMRDCLNITFSSHEIMHFPVDGTASIGSGLVFAGLCCGTAGLPRLLKEDTTCRIPKPNNKLESMCGNEIITGTLENTSQKGLLVIRALGNQTPKVDGSTTQICLIENKARPQEHNASSSEKIRDFALMNNYVEAQQHPNVEHKDTACNTIRVIKSKRDTTNNTYALDISNRISILGKRSFVAHNKPLLAKQREIYPAEQQSYSSTKGPIILKREINSPAVKARARPLPKPLERVLMRLTTESLHAVSGKHGSNKSKLMCHGRADATKTQLYLIKRIIAELGCKSSTSRRLHKEKGGYDAGNTHNSQNKCNLRAAYPQKNRRNLAEVIFAFDKAARKRQKQKTSAARLWIIWMLKRLAGLIKKH
ncbi:MAG: hypothetical protein QXS93_01025 [Candidatus Micrarchaeia archaeon]